MSASLFETLTCWKQFCFRGLVQVCSLRHKIKCVYLVVFCVTNKRNSYIRKPGLQISQMSFWVVLGQAKPGARTLSGSGTALMTWEDTVSTGLKQFTLSFHAGQLSNSPGCSIWWFYFWWESKNNSISISYWFASLAFYALVPPLELLF